MPILQRLPQRAPVRPLPASVIERIAAGEVIERPASVVRELIENALDAQASTIRIAVVEGGLGSIRVSDDGCGIPAAELDQALTKHATSKISSLEDLTHISSLGFRGEALASIAALSELRLCSASDDTGIAFSITMRMGATMLPEHEARSRGTTVTVRDLFTDAPARRAMLRTPAGESALILSTVRAYALTHASLRFTLLCDDQVMLATPGSSASDAVVAVYGADVARSLRPLDPQHVGDAMVSGWVASRAFTQRDTRHIVISVNGRPVSNSVMAALVQSAYRPLLRKGRHPIALLTVETDPRDVDANVHPAKGHVLLRGERSIGAVMRDAVHNALGRRAPESPPPLTALSSTFERMLQPAFPVRRLHKSVHEARTLFIPQHAEAHGRSQLHAQADFRDLTALCQFDNRLIVAASRSGDLLLVDQHRAHERLLYESLSRQPDPARSPDWDGARAGGQLLLEPLVVELTHRQAEVLTPRLTELASLGLVCEPFGGSAFLVRALPLLPDSAIPVSSFATELTADAAEDADTWIEHVRASLACRAALRRGQPLSPEEQHTLLADLSLADVPAVCPHGSPIIVRWPRDQLARTFEW